MKLLSRVQLLATPWTAAHQAPPSMGFSRQEYWSGLACSPPGDLPHLGTEPVSFTSPALSDRFFTTSTTWEAPLLSMVFPNCAYIYVYIFYIVSLYFVAQGDVCLGASTAAKGPRSQPVSPLSCRESLVMHL